MDRLSLWFLFSGVFLVFSGGDDDEEKAKHTEEKDKKTQMNAANSWAERQAARGKAHAYATARLKWTTKKLVPLTAVSDDLDVIYPKQKAKFEWMTVRRDVLVWVRQTPTVFSML